MLPITHSHLPKRAWMLVVVAVVLVASHGILFYVLSHQALSVSIASGVIILVVVKHLGLLGPLYTLIRRRFHH